VKIVSATAGAYIVSITALIAATVLAALGHTVPDELWSLGAVGLGAGAGATVPTRFVETGSTPGTSGVQ
jgi:hypothetical protein